MYRELGPEDHQKMLGLGPDDLPELLILLGVFDVHRGAERFSRYLENATFSRSETSASGVPYYTGEHRGTRVALSGCFGGPMAAMSAHAWCGAGVKTVVQLGWYGALQFGTDLGDVVVPRHAERQDGVSDWYLAKGSLPMPHRSWRTPLQHSSPPAASRSTSTRSTPRPRFSPNRAT
ncbi:MAG: hypothetical protein IPO34_05605 [Dehalococcoidia bacterium]|nr:hypothetical protein [Dehalococcoidia bacterium]